MTDALQDRAHLSAPEHGWVKKECRGLPARVDGKHLVRKRWRVNISVDPRAHHSLAGAREFDAPSESEDDPGTVHENSLVFRIPELRIDNDILVPICREFLRY